MPNEKDRPFTMFDEATTLRKSVFDSVKLPVLKPCFCTGPDATGKCRCQRAAELDELFETPLGKVKR